MRTDRYDSAAVNYELRRTYGDSPKVVSYDEWLRMPEASDVTGEIVDGEIRTIPPNKFSHADVVENLADTLRPHLDRKVAKLLVTNFGLVISKKPATCRTPDLAIFLIENMVVQDDYFFSPPELAVEVLSPANSRRDQARLLRDYESIGVPEFWVLSPEVRTLEVLQLSEGRLLTKAIVSGGQIAPKLFPYAGVDLDSIWP